MVRATTAPADAAPAPPPARGEPAVAPGFDTVYEAHFDFVWRSLRRLGVPEASLDDAAQDVFVVVHRRIAEFEARSSMKTWLFGIALRVARDHRRLARRKGGHSELPDAMPDASPGPHESAERTEAVRALVRVLDTLEDDRREVFVLAELEQMTMAEASQVLGVNPNTLAARLRAARADFDHAVERLHRSRR